MVSNPNTLIRFDLQTGDRFNFATPNEALIIGGTFQYLLYDIYNDVSYELIFNIFESGIIGPSTSFFLAPTAFNIIYKCTDLLLTSTALGLNIGSFNFFASLDFLAPGYILDIRPIDGGPFRIIIDYPLVSTIKVDPDINAYQILPTQPGYTYSIKLAIADVYYDFYIPPEPFDIGQFRSQIRIPNTTLPIINRENIGLNAGSITRSITVAPITNINNVIDICSLDEIPRIWIDNIDADVNLGELKFTITDTEIYDETYCRSDALVICPQNNIYRSTIIKYPQVQSVVKGNVCSGANLTQPTTTNGTILSRCGSSPQCQCSPQTRQTGTLVQKAIWLTKNFDTGLSAGDFYNALGFYSCIRYILSGVLFGEYSEKFLEEQYYQKFLLMLTQSKFNRFIIIFTEPQTLEFPNGPVVVNFSNYYKYYVYGSGCGNVGTVGCNGNINGNINGCKLRIAYGRT